MRWPKGPPHLALNPPYVLFFCFSFCFVFCCPFFALNRKNPVFPLKKAFFVNFLCFSLFLPQPFWLAPCSISLSLSLSCSFVSFFLLVFLFCSLFVSWYFSLSFLSFLLCFCFMKRTTSKYSIAIFCPEILSLFGVSFLFFVSNPFLLSLLFPDFKLCFLFNIKVFDFQTHNLKKKRIFWVKRGVATKRVFLSTCVLQNVKSYRFFCVHFFGNFWVMFKKHCKIGVSAHFKRPKIEKKGHF